MKILWKDTVSAKFRANRPKLCGNCAFPQNFLTRKLGEITVFYAVEGNNNKSIFSGKQSRHSIRKTDTIMATKKAMDADMVNINQETLFNEVKFPYVVPVENLKHIHRYIKSLFCAIKIPNCS